MKARNVMAAFVAILATCSCAKQEAADKVEHWVIVGHLAPGISAMSDAEAARWHGRSVDLGADLATAGPDSCAHPLYDSRPVHADSVLESYKIAPGSLGPSLPPGATVTILETSCHGETWYSPGAILIKTSPTHAFTPWEGLFFELERR
jgi:hypothetical protein